jgi:hypothetical protein
VQEAGVDVVVALTHMRVPNDIQLLEEVPEIDVVLGGHDHHYLVQHVQPHGNLLVKSGTDFRDLTLVEIQRSDSRCVGLSGWLEDGGWVGIDMRGLDAVCHIDNRPFSAAPTARLAE